MVKRNPTVGPDGSLGLSLLRVDSRAAVPVPVVATEMRKGFSPETSDTNNQNNLHAQTAAPWLLNI